MSTTLICDFDGVLNPLPFEKIWIGSQPVEFALSSDIMTARNWKTERLVIDPLLYFDTDHEESVVFDNGYKKQTYVVRWSSELIERINALTNTGAANFHWLSAWQEQCATELAPLLGLQHATTVLPWQQRRSDVQQVGKLIAVEELVLSGKNDPVVWIDDVATHSTENFSDRVKDQFEIQADLEYPSAFMKTGIDHLILKTSTRFGVSREQWQAVEEFVAHHA